MLNRSAAMLLAAATLPLAACDSGPSVKAENATAGEVAEQMADAGGADSFVNPGKWESKMTVEDVSMPGMPPEAVAQMKGMIGNAQATQSCLTPEQAKRPKEDFFAGTEQNCRYDHFTMSGGKIDAAMKCAHEGGTQVMQMAGSYSGDSYTMVMQTATTGQGPTSGMKMRMRVDAKRLGACDGTEEKS